MLLPPTRLLNSGDYPLRTGMYSLNVTEWLLSYSEILYYSMLCLKFTFFMVVLQFTKVPYWEWFVLLEAWKFAVNSMEILAWIFSGAKVQGLTKIIGVYLWVVINIQSNFQNNPTSSAWDTVSFHEEKFWSEGILTLMVPLKKRLEVHQKHHDSPSETIRKTWQDILPGPNLTSGASIIIYINHYVCWHSRMVLNHIRWFYMWFFKDKKNVKEKTHLTEEK